MHRNFFSIGPPGLILAALCLLICMEGCASRLPSFIDEATHYGQSPQDMPSTPGKKLWDRALKLIDEKADPTSSAGFSLDFDPALLAPAMELATAQLESMSARGPEVLLEHALSRHGIAVRPATVEWISTSKNGRDLTEPVAATLHRLAKGGFSHGALATACKEEVRIVVILAVKRNLRLTEPLPRFIARGDRIKLSAAIGDEFGLLEMTARAPNGLLHKEDFPFFGGSLEISMKLDMKGVYRFELANPQIEGGSSTILLFNVAVQDRRRSKQNLPDSLDAERFNIASVSEIFRLREKRQRKPLARCRQCKLALEKWVRKEADALLPSANLILREVDLDTSPKKSCSYLSSYGHDPTSILAANLDRPIYQKTVLDRRATSYSSWIESSQGGYRVGEIVCRPYEQSEIVMMSLQRHGDRSAYRLLLNRKLEQLMGLTIDESESQALDRWLMAESMAALQKVGGISAILLHQRLQQGLERENTGFTHRRKLLDEVFVTVWEVLARMRASLPENDPRLGSLSLFIMQILLHQDRTDSFMRELKSMEKLVVGRDPGHSARVVLAASWLAAYRGLNEESLRLLMAAIKGYELIHYDQLLQKLAVQAVLMYRLVQDEAS